MLAATPPKFELVKRTLIRDIVLGQNPAGSRFPSESRLLQQFDVSRPTLVRALRELTDEGYLYRKRGKGTYVGASPPSMTSDMPVTHFTVFISREFAQLAGAGHELQLKILRGMQAALTASQGTYCVRETASGKLEASTIEYIESSPRGVALVVEPSSISPELLVMLKDRDWAVWSVNEPMDGVNYVCIDQEQAGYIATRHLLTQGRTHPALINGPEDLYWGFKARRDGYERALREAGIEKHPGLICQGYHAIDSEAGRTMMRELIDSGQPLDAVVAASDAKAIGAMAQAVDSGIRERSQIAFVSIDNTLAKTAAPPLSAVAMPFEEMGCQAALQAKSSAMCSHRRNPVNIKISLQPFLVER